LAIILNTAGKPTEEPAQSTFQQTSFANFKDGTHGSEITGEEGSRNKRFFPFYRPYFYRPFYGYPFGGYGYGYPPFGGFGYGYGYPGPFFG